MDLPSDYLAGLPEAQRYILKRINKPGLTMLLEQLSFGEAVAFLGAGVSAPLYPLWDELIAQLIDAAADQMKQEEATTCRELAAENPEEVVEIVRRRLSSAAYRQVLREVLQARTDPDSGRTWTLVQELICRCDFKGIVTTNYDPGIVDARMRVRPNASATGFTTWTDELGLDRWRTGDVFGDAELPILYAHGHHNQPDSVVLASLEYRRAYEGKLSKVLERLVDSGHLLWLGFSFADQRIGTILREVSQASGPRIEPGGPLRHVAVMAWDCDSTTNDPGILVQRAEIRYGARLVLYPLVNGDHSPLSLLLRELTDPRFPPVAAPQVGSPVPLAGAETARMKGNVAVAERWVPAPEYTPNFTGRAEELARIGRWAADSTVKVIGVTAWGGAGKTALVTHWATHGGAVSSRSALQGIFGWSFYADPSAEHWATALLEWGKREFGIPIVPGKRHAAAVLDLLRTIPLLLVLDGLEVAQEGPAGAGFGRLLDGTLREVLVTACQHSPESEELVTRVQPQSKGLIVLTSRFPFADLETFDGSTARMLEVPAFTVVEGAELLAAAGGEWMAEVDRRRLVSSVDGHALAVGVLAGIVTDRSADSDLEILRSELRELSRTAARVTRVLQFYADRLSEDDRYLVAAISLFAHPVTPGTILELAARASSGHLSDWTPSHIEDIVRYQLRGLVSLYPDGSLSAHPLVRDTFRPLAIGAAAIAASITLTDIPAGHAVVSKAEADRVHEAIELLLDARQWRAADALYETSAGNGDIWLDLPAATLGQRAAIAFAAPSRRDECSIFLGAERLGFYHNQVGLFAMMAGDMVTALEYLLESVRYSHSYVDPIGPQVLQNLTDCLGHLGRLEDAKEAAARSLEEALGKSDRKQIITAHAYAGWIAGLSGDSHRADSHFHDADRLHFAHESKHLSSLAGVLWAEFLAQTGRSRASRTLTEQNMIVSVQSGWTIDVALCERVLGRLDIASGDIDGARWRLDAAILCFREGDYLVEVATTLTDMAEVFRISGDLDLANRLVTEAISIAAPRRLVPVQAAALAMRARVQGAQFAATNDETYLSRGRDAADAALRLSTLGNSLPWCELDALQAHVALDQAEGVDHEWFARAGVLSANLVPPDLDPDPLITADWGGISGEPL